MNEHTNSQQLINLLNHLFMAYFLNEAEKLGVDFYNTRPSEYITKGMLGNYFSPGNNDYAYMKHFHWNKIVIQDIDLDRLREKHIEDFFDDEIKQKLHEMAKNFSEVSKEYPFSDYIFSMLPEALPLVNACYRDEDTGFTARMIYGRNFAEAGSCIIFEFYCLILRRFRKIQDPLGREAIQDVECMTPEEREIFDVQPEDK